MSRHLALSLCVGASAVVITRESAGGEGEDVKDDNCHRCRLHRVLAALPCPRDALLVLGARTRVGPGGGRVWSHGSRQLSHQPLHLHALQRLRIRRLAVPAFRQGPGFHHEHAH